MTPPEPEKPTPDDGRLAKIIGRAIIEYLSDEQDKSNDRVVEYAKSGEADAARMIRSEMSRLEWIDGAISMIGRMPLRIIAECVAADRQSRQPPEQPR